MLELKHQLREILGSAMGAYRPSPTQLIAGGAVANTLLNLIHKTTLPINDIDIFSFIPNPDLGAATQANLISTTDYDYPADFIVWATDLPKIQLITHRSWPMFTWDEKAYALINQFNFNATQAAYHWASDTLYYTPAFERFVNHRQILYNPLPSGNAVLNILKSYKKHTEGVGQLTPTYFRNVFGGYQFTAKDTGSKLALAEALVKDTSYQVSQHSDHFEIAGGPLTSKYLRANIAWVNFVAEGFYFTGAAKVFDEYPELFMGITMLDPTWLAKNHRNIFSLLKDKALKPNLALLRLEAILRLPNPDVLLDMLNWASKAELPIGILNACIQTSKNVSSLSAIKISWEYFQRAEIQKQMFVGQIVTLDKLEKSGHKHSLLNGYTIFNNHPNIQSLGYLGHPLTNTELYTYLQWLQYVYGELPHYALNLK